MNMIEELWYGNVNPTEQPVRRGRWKRCWMSRCQRR